MKHNKTTILATIAFLMAAPFTAANAANQDTSTSDAQEIQRLEEIAGKPTKYQEDPKSKTTTYAVVDSGCTLDPSQVHKRKSGNWGTVGAKPSTKCNTNVKRISHDSKLYIIEWAGLHRKEMAHKSNANTNQKSLTLTSLEWTCKNNHNSKFQQVTEGQVTTSVKTFVTTAATIKSTIDCGY